MHRRLSSVAALLGLAILASSPSGADRTRREVELRVAFLYNFTKFVEWPAEAFDEPESPLCIGVVGRDTLAGPLDELEQRTVQGRPIEVRRFSDPDRIEPCHVLFFDSTPERPLGAIRNRLADANVLMVGEGERFVERGGTIGLVERKNKLTFTINLAAAEEAGLEISSKLLRLASKIVESERIAENRN